MIFVENACRESAIQLFVVMVNRIRYIIVHVRLIPSVYLYDLLADDLPEGYPQKHRLFKFVLPNLYRIDLK
jgi:hypothetical protein